MRPRNGAAPVVVLVVLALSVAGCSGDDDSDGATTPTASSSQVTQSPTGFPSSEGELPESFPSEEVPLVEGAIGEVLENADLNSYLIKVYPDTDFASAFEDATSKLTDAGFEQGPDVISAGPTSSTADFTSEDWFVVITGGLPGRTLVQYTIYPAE